MPSFTKQEFKGPPVALKAAPDFSRLYLVSVSVVSFPWTADLLSD